MERLQVKASSRADKGKGAARKIRAKGEIPGVVYGVGMEPLPLQVNQHDFDTVLKGTEITNVLIDLEIDGKETVCVMLRDFQVDIIKRFFTHVDFQKIDLKKKLKLEIPIHLVGKAPGVKEGGILEHTRRTLEVRCLPTAIPEAIDVDVSALDIGDTIHLSDITLPEGVEPISAADFTIAAVVEPKEEKVEEAVAEEGAPTEPEVIGEKKAEEGAPAEEAKEEKKE